MKKNRLIAFLVCIILVLTVFPNPTVLAAALSPYEGIEDDGNGTVTYHNKDGSTTIEVSLTDDQISQMSASEEADRLKDSGSHLEGTDGDVAVKIDKELTEDGTLVSAEKDGTAIEFRPEVTADAPAQEEPQASSAPLPTEEESASSQEPALPATPSISSEPAAPEAPTEPSVEPAPSENIPTETTPAPTEEPTPTQAPTEPPIPTESTSSSAEPTVPPTTVPTTVSLEPVNIDAKKIGYSNGTYSAALFESVFDEATDIELSALKGGVKENIIINEYLGNHSFSYIIKFTSLTPQSDGNAINLLDEDGNIAARIAAPYMTDKNGGYSEDIDVTLESIGGGEYRLTYTPSDSWLSSVNRAYPVAVDPTVTYTSSDTYGVEDNYVSNTSPGTNHQYNQTWFRVGNDGTAIHTAYIRPVVPDSLKNVADNVIIKSASVKMYETTGKSGGSTYAIHQVTGGAWNAREITFNNAPEYSGTAEQTKSIDGGGWVTWDITKMFSTWFNALDQKGNFGFAITATSNNVGDYRQFQSADTPSNRLTYSVTYFESPAKAAVTVNKYGNGANSGTGYVNLSWSAVTGADNYYIGIFNGREYEYFYVGSATSFTTKNKGIWPTQTEIAAGRYALHGDGAGTELPMMPALTYANAGTAHASDIKYYFKVVPANTHGQAINPGICTTKEIILPDTIPPNIPSAVTVSPSTWTNAASLSVSWSGVTDFNNTAGGASSSLGTGKIQYSIDGGAWKDTTKNTATGTYDFSSAGLADGTHSIYICGKDAAGNIGLPKGVNFYTDKTAPTAPTLSVTPDSWTKDTSVSLTWSGISDLNALARVEYSIDGGSYTTTATADKAYSGFDLDISSLASGTHTLSVRGVDIAGNNGVAGSISIYKDVDAPVVTETKAAPPSWTTSDDIAISWAGLSDIHSGLKIVSYNIDGGAETDLSSVAADDSFTVDAAALADGEHTVTLTFKDNLDNTLTRDVKIYRDVTNPAAAITAPDDGDIVNGTIEVWGSVADTSLDEWTLSAKGSSGKTVEVKKDSAEAANAMLGILNTSVFADGETIEITLFAKDKAGNSSTVSGIVIKVDKSAKPIAGSVDITSPTSGQTMNTAAHKGSYENKYSGTENKGYYYIDSKYMGNTASKTFDFDAITYPEDSAHTISVISEDTAGTLHYSSGLSAYMALSDSFADNSFTASKTGVIYTTSGVKLTGTSGEIVFKEVTSPKNILALRLKTTQATPAGTSIEYAYSIDGGATWNAITPGKDTLITVETKKITLKATLTGSGGATPVLYGADLESVIEMNPTRVSIKLQRDAQSLSMAASPLTHAITGLTATDTNVKALYMDNALIGSSFDFNALSVTENSAHTLLAIGEKDGVVYGTNATSAILLRKNVNASGTIESGRLTSAAPVYAIRLDALSLGSGRYYYSLDGAKWTAIQKDKYVFLEKGASAIYFKAEMGGSTLKAWHIEAVSAFSEAYTVDLVKEPTNVVAADWGDYYDNEKLKKFIISWKDANTADSTATNATVFEINRNGVKIGETSDTRYTDMDYVPGAKYSVRTVRTYASGAYPVRISATVYAKSNTIAKEQRIEGVKHDVYTFAQSEYMNKLYGGNYTFSDSMSAPTGDRALNQKLLGKNKYCAIGFEPVNFNTGNFFLEMQDFFLDDLLDIDVTRTYNAQSESKDGPFGSKWEFAYSAHLVLYKNGDVGYRRADGSQIQFYLQKDGSYKGNDDDFLSLGTNTAKTEYIVTETDGTKKAFSSGGLLAYIEDSKANRVKIDRDEDGTGLSPPSPRPPARSSA